MTAKKNIVRKHFRLGTAKIKRAHNALGARSETEAIDGALDLVISEHKNNRLLDSGICEKDSYGTRKNNSGVIVRR